jgi:hypothetical protein
MQLIRPLFHHSNFYLIQRNICDHTFLHSDDPEQCYRLEKEYMNTGQDKTCHIQ